MFECFVGANFTDWQAVCVDDGSTDETYEILKKYAQKDKRIIAIHQDNHGVEWARANAMEHIKSPYVMFCDPDDWYESQMCQKMLTTLERESTDIVMCGVNVVGIKDVEMEKYFSNVPAIGKHKNPVQFCQKGGLALWRFIFKKELLDTCELFFPKDKNVRRGYDISFIMQYFMAAKSICFLPDKLYNYWQRSDSLVHQFNTGKSKNKFDVWYGFEYVVKFMVKNNFYDVYKNDIFSCFNARFPSLLSKISDDGKKQAIEIIKKILTPYQSDVTKKANWLWAVFHWPKEKLYKKILDHHEIKLMGLSLYQRIKNKKNKKVFVFGMPIFEKIKENGNKEIYLCKLCVYRTFYGAKANRQKMSK